MSRNKLRESFLILALLVMMAPAPAMAQVQIAARNRASVAQLVEHAAEYDGKEVEIEGELIGDLMYRGDHAWLSVLDSGTAMSVWAAKKDIPDFSFLGNYSARGDRVLVRGTLHRACPEHGGDLDIHAASIEVVDPGRPESHHVDTLRLVAGLASTVAGACLVVYWRRRERRVGRL